MVVLALRVKVRVERLWLGPDFTQGALQVIQGVQMAAAFAVVHFKARGLAQQSRAHAHAKPAAHLPACLAFHGAPPT